MVCLSCIYELIIINFFIFNIFFHVILNPSLYNPLCNRIPNINFSSFIIILPQPSTNFPIPFPSTSPLITPAPHLRWCPIPLLIYQLIVQFIILIDRISHSVRIIVIIDEWCWNLLFELIYLLLFCLLEFFERKYHDFLFLSILDYYQ